MAATFKLIQKTELTSTTSTITFSAIPQTYDDLYLVVAAASNNSGRSSLRVSFNGYTGNAPEGVEFAGYGTSTQGYRNTGASGEFYIYPGVASTANTGQGGCEIYMPRYTSSSTFMPIVYNSVVEENGNTGQNVLLGGAVIYNYSVAKTSIGLALFSGATFSANSGFYLYGIKNS